MKLGDIDTAFTIDKDVLKKEDPLALCVALGGTLMTFIGEERDQIGGDSSQLKLILSMIAYEAKELTDAQKAEMCGLVSKTIREFADMVDSVVADKYTSMIN